MDRTYKYGSVPDADDQSVPPTGTDAHRHLVSYPYYVGFGEAIPSTTLEGLIILVTNLTEVVTTGYV